MKQVPAKSSAKQLLIDGREFVAKRTGIGRFLEGLLLAIHDQHPDWQLTVAMNKQGVLPLALDGKVHVVQLPVFVDLAWPRLTKNCDLFLSPYPKLPWFQLACPEVHAVHDVFYLTHPLYNRNRLRTMAALWLLKHSIAKAQLTWFVSHASKEACEALVGPVQPSAVRYSPVESSFTPSDCKNELDDTPFFLCVGNGMPHKNVEVLLKAIQGTELQLICVGASAEAQARLLAAVPVVHQQVTFMVGVDDTQLIELYRRAVALLLPSVEEGYGFPPLEAMACGTPAIVSDIPVLRESTGGMAVYCPPHAVSVWQEAMVSMLDAGIREQHRQRAIQWVKCRQGQAGWHEHLVDLETVMGDA